MAKRSKIAKEKKRREIVARYAAVRADLKRRSVDPHLPAEERDAAMTALHRLPRDASPGTRAHGNARFERLLQPDVLRVIGELEHLATQNGWSLTELALGWLLHQPQVHSVIAGVTSQAQVDANASAVRVALTTAHLTQIDTIVAGLPAGLDL